MKKVLLALVVLTVLAGAAAAGFFYLERRRLLEFAREPFGSDEAKVVFEEIVATHPDSAEAAAAYAFTLHRLEDEMGARRHQTRNCSWQEYEWSQPAEIRWRHFQAGCRYPAPSHCFQLSCSYSSFVSGTFFAARDR